MTLAQAIQRVESKATRMEILARVERGDRNPHVADQLDRDAAALRCVLAAVRAIPDPKNQEELSDG